MVFGCLFDTVAVAALCSKLLVFGTLTRAMRRWMTPTPSFQVKHG
jgi:hypothetical protein